MVLPHILDHTCVHCQPRCHPFLPFFFAISILLATPLLDVPLTVDALCCIMLHGHLLPNMLKWVEGLGVPSHQAVLCHQLDPLSSMEGSGSPHTVLLCPTVAALDILHFLKHLCRVEWLHTCGQLFIAREPRVRQGHNAIHNAVVLNWNEPHVVPAGLGVAGWTKRLIGVLHMLPRYSFCLILLL